jgi:hypothetical protein
VDDHAPAVRVTVDALAPLAAAVDEAVSLQRPDEAPDGEVPEPLDRTVIATAGASRTSIMPVSTGMTSPASTMSST